MGVSDLLTSSTDADLISSLVGGSSLLLVDPWCLSSPSLPLPSPCNTATPGEGGGVFVGVRDLTTSSTDADLISSLVGGSSLLLVEA